jgi:hypothetical protein
MLIRPDFSKENAQFEPSRVSVHLKRFPAEPGGKLGGNFAGQQIFASGTRDFQKEVALAVEKNQQLIFDGFLNMPFKHQGHLIICDFNRRCLYAQTDPINLFPAFWHLNNGAFTISDRLSQLHAAVGGQTDDVGVAEIISLDYTVGQRTLFHDIKRLRAAESLRFEWDTRKVVTKDMSRLWTERDDSSREEILRKGCDLFVEACRQMDGTMLMMSAGWDSKTLLAGAAGAGVLKNVQLYYHGAADSREANIIRRQSDRLNFKLTMNPLVESMFDSKFLEDSFENAEDVSHPHWHAAAHFAARPDSGVETICAGIFGEIMGGHTGPPVTLKGFKKMASTFGYLSGIKFLSNQSDASKPNNPRDAAYFLNVRPNYRPWYIKESVWKERFEGVHERINGDVALAIERYVERGVKTKESVIEACITENRFTQIVSDQLRSTAAFRPLIAPFGHRDFLEYSCRVPFEKKVHRTLNQNIIRTLFPDLLEFPTAAILCRSKRPILMQEATRAIRHAAEDAKWSVHIKTNGLVAAPNLGWPNFQFLQHSAVLKNMIDNLRSPIWDRDRMRTFIDNYGYRNYHGLQGVMVKVKTLDLFGIA